MAEDLNALWNSAKPTAYKGATPALSDEMDAIDSAGGVVDIKVGPDGKVIKPAEDLNALWRSAKPVSKPVETPKQEQKLPAIGDMIPQVGAAETGAALTSGVVAAPVAGIVGLGTLIGKTFGITDADPAEIIKKVQGALTYTPNSKVGQQGVEVLTAPLELIAKGAQKASDKTFEVTGSPALATAVNTGINIAAPGVAMKGAQMAKTGLRAAAAESDAAALLKNQQNAEGARVTTASKEAGYTLPPSQVNPSAVNATVEGLSGAPKVAIRASIKNQPVTNKLVREDIGLPENVPATPESLASLRTQAGKAYDEIKQVGTIRNDSQYFQDLKEITKSFDTAAESYKGVANPIADVIKSLEVETASAPAAIEMVKILRGKADTAYRTGDAPLGKAYRQSAQAIDDSLSRYLQEEAFFSENPALAGAVERYQAARQQIAKTYTAEKALRAGGNFDAAVYARELGKGKPLTGNAKTVGEFATKFEKAARVPDKLPGDTLGYGDLLLASLKAGGGGGAVAVAGALGGPGAAAGTAAALLARPTARAILTSKPYQKAFVNPEKATGRRSLSALSTLADLQSSPMITLAELANERRE